jgi:hypothetical protein
LLGELDACERLYAEARSEAEHARSTGDLSARYKFQRAEGLRWRPDPEGMPGIRRVELLCDLEPGDPGVTAAKVRGLRAKVARLRGLTLDQADALDLNAVATALEEPATAPKEPAERPEPTATDRGGVGESTPEPDGPFGPDGFRFGGASVRFGRAGKQRSLVLALWDQHAGCRRDFRAAEDVITEVYGEENDTSDSAFRQLCSDTQKRLDIAGVPLTIVNRQGKVGLADRPG